MPALTRWFIKASLLHFLAALLTGALAALPLGLERLSPVYFHLFLVGWVTQLIFGVVFWMFPKYSLEKPRGSEQLGWLCFWALNTGLVLRAASEPTGWRWGLVLSALLQWAAGLAFVANTWGRVKEK